MNSKDLILIKGDLKILLQSVSEDYKAEQWASYPGYTHQYNKLRERVFAAGVVCDVENVAGLSRGEIGAYGHVGGGTTGERAKYPEIITKTKQLLLRVEAAIEPEREPKSEKNVNSLEVITLITGRFHTFYKQIIRRHAQRETITIEDEYDVQDILHALLKLFFDDIREEEWVPSYLGSSKRMDFLLKNEQIVIEVKKTRKGLAAKEIGDELAIDITQYKTHQDCKKLVCFIYDPESRISNPAGLINDLKSLSTDETEVLAFVCQS